MNDLKDSKTAKKPGLFWLIKNGADYIAELEETIKYQADAIEQANKDSQKEIEIAREMTIAAKYVIECNNNLRKERDAALSELDDIKCENLSLATQRDALRAKNKANEEVEQFTTEINRISMMQGEAEQQQA
ncbi:MAG: hypothetical protein LBL46_04965 [Rickettsiales bacterium]|jgi:hypothetical protein|nr:hypothetical protein [Rickettsiales bacterium]